MSDFIYKGKEIKTIRDLLDGAIKVVEDDEAQQYLDAYRAVNEHADANLGYVIGYLEPPSLRKKIYSAFSVVHPIFGSNP